MRANMDSKMKATPEVSVEDAEKKVADMHVLMQAELETIVRSPDGKVSHHDVRKAESFVRQWLELLWVHAASLGRVSEGYAMRDTGNGLRRIRTHMDNWFLHALAAVDTHGILVGLGTTAPTIDDYRMEDQIPHGIIHPQLQYSDMAVGYPGINMNISQITITRSFANASGSAVTVYEIGAALRAYDRASWSGIVRYFLVLRDVIAAGIGVPVGDTLTINYRLQCEL